MFEHLLIYLRETLDYGIEFNGFESFRLAVYTDVDWAEHKSDRKSITDSLLKMTDESIFCRSAKQTSVALFITKVEYIAIFEIFKKLLAIREIVIELRVLSSDYIFSLLIDSNEAIVLFKGENITRNVRHVNIRYHHIRDLIERGLINVLYISSLKMIADGLIESLSKKLLMKFVGMLNLTSRQSKTSSE